MPDVDLSNLSPFDHSQFAMCEAEFQRVFLRTIAMATLNLPDAVGTKLIGSATADIAGGKLNFPSPGFYASAMSRGSLPFLLWAALGRTNPKLTRGEAAAMITADNENAVGLAVLKAIGVPLATVTPKLPEAAEVAA